MIRVAFVPVGMRQAHAIAGGDRAKRRVDHRDADVGIDERVVREKAAQEIFDAHRVALGNGYQRSLPDTHEPKVGTQLKLRPGITDRRILRADR